MEEVFLKHTCAASFSLSIDKKKEFSCSGLTFRFCFSAKLIEV